jgi:SAM-dependent methyltransferase
MNNLLSLLDDIFNNFKLVKATLSGVKNKSNITKVEIKPFQGKDGINYQFAKYEKEKVFHSNLNAKEAIDELVRLMEINFTQALIKSLDHDYQVFFNSDGKVKILTKVATNKEINLEHNKVKNYIFKEGNMIPFLFELGVMNSSGQVIKAKFDKFKQINRFIEYIDDVVTEFKDSKMIRIIDFGCGKSYLTFAIHHYLTQIKNYEVDIVGLDLKEDVIEQCNSIVKKYNLKGIRFLVGDISKFNPVNNVDMVVTLHACNTATDYALYQAIKWNAKVILSVPCCHHELNDQISSQNLSILLEQGIVKERISALMTDVIRSSLLQLEGYKSQIIEFIDIEHTPKNLLIRAVKTSDTKNNVQVKAKLLKLKQEFGFNLTLEKLLNINYD